MGVVRVKSGNQGEAFSESCRGKVWESKGGIQWELWE